VFLACAAAQLLDIGRWTRGTDPASSRRLELHAVKLARVGGEDRASDPPGIAPGAD
jgi:hypothetical protein